MSVGYEAQTYAMCDMCNVCEVSSLYTLAIFKQRLRLEGWTFGKKTICPECNERRKRLRNSMRRQK